MVGWYGVYGEFVDFGRMPEFTAPFLYIESNMPRKIRYLPVDSLHDAA